jgi:hypothetical protein
MHYDVEDNQRAPVITWLESNSNHPQLEHHLPPSNYLTRNFPGFSRWVEFLRFLRAFVSCAGTYRRPFSPPDPQLNAYINTVLHVCQGN